MIQRTINYIQSSHFVKNSGGAILFTTWLGKRSLFYYPFKTYNILAQVTDQATKILPYWQVGRT